MDQDEGTSRRRAKNDNDTFVLVKEYISSEQLRQPPLLVLRAEDRDSFPLTTNRISKDDFVSMFVHSFAFQTKFWSTRWFSGSVSRLVSVPRQSGVMARRPVPQIVADGWMELAKIFERLLGGSEATVQAAKYLRGLAQNNLPLHELHPLPWHEAEPDGEQFAARFEPHPCVLAVLCPSVPLRAVWKRNLR